MKHDSENQRLPRTPCLFLRPVAVRRYLIPNHGRVEARLWRLFFNAASTVNPGKTVYAIELRGLGSRRFCLLEGDEARARAILSLLVRHTVTPCGLRDVLEEL